VVVRALGRARQAAPHRPLAPVLRSARAADGVPQQSDLKIDQLSIDEPRWQCKGERPQEGHQRQATWRGGTMSEHEDRFLNALWAENLDEVDREIARLAMLCKVRILDAGVMQRVLKRDATVCGTPNSIAFDKLHDLLMLHLALREKSAAAVGQAKTAAIEDYIIERLGKAFPELRCSWPPA
jgi:hypothetical protein